MMMSSRRFDLIPSQVLRKQDGEYVMLPASHPITSMTVIHTAQATVLGASVGVGTDWL